MIRLVILLFSLLAIHTSCEVINPAEEVPFFVKVDKIDVCTADSCYDESIERGTNRHNLPDAWVFANDNLIGAFELPATVPVLAKGNVKISVQGGIKSNGIIGDAQQYNFFEPDDTTINTTPGETYQFNPTLTYRSRLFYWHEQFEGENSGIKMQAHFSSDTTIQIVKDSSEVFEGIGSGYAVLSDETHQVFRGESSEPISLPRGVFTYVELHYKCNNPFSVGIVSKPAGNPEDFDFALTLRSTLNEATGLLEWRKVYIDISPSIDQSVGGPRHLMFEMFKITNQAELYLDNIKVVHAE